MGNPRPYQHLQELYRITRLATAFHLYGSQGRAENRGPKLTPCCLYLWLMVIAVDTRTCPFHEAAYNQYITHLVERLVAEHPEHRFVLFVPETGHLQPTAPAQVVWVPRQTNPWLRKAWYHLKLPRLLKAAGADVFLSFCGMRSTGTSLPQTLLLPHLSARELQALPLSQRLFYQFGLPRFLKKTVLGAASLAAAKSWLERAGQQNQQVELVQPAAVRPFKELQWNEKQFIKEQFAGGGEYFLNCGPVPSEAALTDLLRAFSLFKKRQQSGMKLLLPAGRLYNRAAAESLLKTYRYKEAVAVVAPDSAEAEARLTGAAYATIHLPGRNEGVTLLQSLASGTPVLAAEDPLLNELAGDAALYFPAGNPQELAQQMMFIYKDEGYRSRMVSQGLQQAAAHSLENSAGQLYRLILKAYGRQPT